MSDNLLRSELSNLERKVLLLLNQHQKNKDEIEVLKKEVEGLKGQLSDKEQQIAGFQNKDNIVKIVNGTVADESHAEELGEVLNEYIKEVDKCIAQLSE